MAALAATGIALLYFGEPDSLRPERQTVPSVVVRRDEAPPALEKPLPSVARSSAVTAIESPTEPPSGELFRAFQTADDLRIFVEMAKRVPSKGGLLYADAALTECRTFREEGIGQRAAVGIQSRSTSEPDQQLVKKQADSLDWLEKRCASFTSDELSLTERRSLITWGADVDPLWKLQRSMSRAYRATSGGDARTPLMQAALSARDPLLLEIVRSLAWTRQPGASSSVIYVDSAPFGGLDAESFNLAWRLFQCTAASDCGAADAMLRQECALGGVCQDSIEASVRSQAGSSARYDRIVSVAARLSRIASHGDVRAFLPP